MFGLEWSSPQFGYTLASLKNDKERLLTPPPMLLSMLKEQKREQVE